MNKIAEWQPSKIAKYEPRSPWSKEEFPNELYKRRFLESGGDPKFGPHTLVQVRRTGTATTVELSTTKAVCFGLLGDRHMMFTQRKRWKELQEILE